MSAHRPTLEAVPWTNTTGIRPGRNGCAKVSLVGISWRRRSPKKNARPFQAPLRRLTQRPGQGGGRLDIERDRAPVDGHHSLTGIAVELE
jgi:hypothetical protein